MADDLEDVDFEDPGNAEDEGWETEDEMEAEAEQDDSELTFSRHTGRVLPLGLYSHCQAGLVCHLLNCASLSLSRLSVLREFGSCNEQLGCNRRRGR